MGVRTPSLSSRKYFFPWSLRGFALASLAQFASPRRLVGGGLMGSSPSAGRIGDVGHRDEEHPIGPVLPANPSFLRERITKSGSSALCVNPAFRDPGHGQQVIHGDSARGSLLVRLVGRRPVAVAQPDESGADFSNLHRCQRLIDVDARTATGDRHRSSMGPDLAGAPGNGG